MNRRPLPSPEPELHKDGGQEVLLLLASAV